MEALGLSGGHLRDATAEIATHVLGVLGPTWPTVEIFEKAASQSCCSNW